MAWPAHDRRVGECSRSAVRCGAKRRAAPAPGVVIRASLLTAVQSACTSLEVCQTTGPRREVLSGQRLVSPGTLDRYRSRTTHPQRGAGEVVDSTCSNMPKSPRDWGAAKGCSNAHEESFI